MIREWNEGRLDRNTSVLAFDPKYGKIRSLIRSTVITLRFKEGVAGQ